MATYSYSKLNLFYNCPYCYYLRYIDGRKGSKGNGITEFGSFVHEILEKYSKNELDMFELQSYYENYFDAFVKNPVELVFPNGFKKNMFEAYYSSGYDYLGEFEGFDFEISDVEYEFYENITDDIQLHGKIDLVGWKDKKLIVADHKSKNGFKDAEEKKDYAKQLYIYAFALYRKYGVFPEEMFFNMFRKGIWEKVVFNKKDYDAALTWVQRTVEAINSTNVFEAIPNSFFCDNFCGYRNGDCECLLI